MTHAVHARLTRAFLLLCLMLAVPAAAQPAPQAAQTCRVESVSGDGATIERGGRPMPAQAGDGIRRDDVIQTGPDGRAVIDCPYGARIVLAPGTRADLGGVIAASASPGPAMSLLRGAAGFLMRLTGGARFSVRTPTAVAAVRSTRWAMTVGEDGATAVFVAEGAVAARAGVGGATLTAGQGLDVAANGAAGPVQRWEAARVSALAARLGPDWR